MHSKPNRRKLSGGFSLLELLLAASLIPLVSFVIFSNISSGMRLWRAVNQSVFEEDLSIFRSKISSDFEQAFKYATIPFVGEPTRLSFASTMDVPAVLGGDRGIGQASFFYDASAHALVKQEANLSDLFKESAGRSHVVLRNVRRFEVRYFSYNVLEDEYLWDEEWDPDKKSLPVAIRFLCELEGQREPLVFTFALPAGG